MMAKMDVPYASLYALAGVLNAGSSFAFGLFVLFKSPNRRTGRIWFWFSLTVALYGLALIGIAKAQTLQHSAWAWRLSYMGAIIWIAPALYHFVTEFLEAPNRLGIIINYTLAAVFCGLVPTKWFFGDYRWFLDSFYFANGGPLFALFLVWWMGLVIWTHLVMVRAFKQASRARRHQIEYFFLATVLGFCGGSYGYLANLGWNLFPWGNFTVCIYPAIMSMAIVRHQLWDIRLVVRTTLIYSAVTAVFAVAYVVLVTVASYLVTGGTRPANLIPSLIATGIIAVLFHPIQTKIHRWISRRFPQESIDPAFLREATGVFVHEIKRPLATITLPAEMALADLKQLSQRQDQANHLIPRIQKYVETVISKSMDLANMIEALRGLSDDEKGELEIISMDELADWIEHEAKALSQGLDIAFSLEDDNTLKRIRGNRHQLKVVIRNLLKNSIEALRNAQMRKLRVCCRASSTHVTIEVIDTGQGIASGDLEQIFKPYFTTKGSGGTGIGLYLCRKILLRHGGNIYVNSQLNQGTTFEIHLPLANVPSTNLRKD